MPLPELIGAYDLETTGPDPEQDRIVTAFAGVWSRATDSWVDEHYFLVDPGVPISPGATAVHGYSDADVQQAGEPAKDGIFALNQRLDIIQRRAPIAGFNLRFDFTMLDRETRRHWPGMRPWHPNLVLDGFVLDKGADRYRKGKRRLTDVAARWGVPVAEDAHDAAADCLMAARLVNVLLQHRQYMNRSLQQIHDYQVNAAAEQARSLADHFASQDGDDRRSRTVRGEWPLVPFTERSTT